MGLTRAAPAPAPTPQVRFERRFVAFAPIQRPKLASYADFRLVIDAQIKACPVADVMRSSENFFRSAKATLDKAVRHEAITAAVKTECAALARVSVSNAVFLATLKEDATGAAQFSFAAHAQFPTVSLKA